MRQRRGTFSGVGGLPIAHREWLTEAVPHGSVVIVHGINEHGGRYRHVAQRLVAAGWTVGALDHRGHGLSGGRRAAVERYDDWLSDLDTYIEQVFADAPHPRVLLGHSLGGLIAIAYALRHEGRVDGLIVSAPSVVPPRLSGPSMRAGRFLSRWMANLPLVPLRLDAVSRDPDVVTAYRNDPLVHLGRVRARTGAEVVDAIAEVRRDISRLRLPLLALQGTDDLLVEPGAAEWVHAHAGSTDRQLHVYPGLYHEVLNEPEGGAVLDDVVRWLEAHASIPALAG